MTIIPALVLALAASFLPHASAAILAPLEVHQSINITGVTAVAVSPDGNHVYAVAQDGDSLARYDRNPDGSLEFVSILRDGVGGIDGLDGARDVALSPDGSHVYVVADTDDAISVFARDALTGALTLVQSLRGDEVAFPLDFPRRVVLSPDGAHVYVVKSNGVLAFARSPLTGRLTFVQHVASESTRALALSPDGIDVYLGGDFGNLLHYARDTLSGTLTFVDVASNLTSPADLVVSPDGTTVYATRGNGIAAFSRGPGGALTWFPGGYGGSGEFVGLVIDTTGSHVYAVDQFTSTLHVIARDVVSGTLAPLQVLADGSGGIDGLGRAADVALSPDGGAVYVAGAADAAVAVFDRDGSTGSLTLVEADADANSGDGELVNPGRPIVASDGLHVYVPAQSVNGRSFARLAVFSRSTLDGSLSPGSAALSGVTFEDVVISPDGKHVYVARRVPDQVEAYARSTATGALTPIASYPGPRVCELSASPDGRHVYASPCTPAAVQVFERDQASGLLTPGATTSPPFGVFTFSADGRFAYADGDGGFDLYARDPGTGVLTFVAREDNDDPEFDDTLVGRVLVAVTADDRHAYAYASGNSLDQEAVNAFRRDALTGRLKFIRAQSGFVTVQFSNAAERGQLAITPDGSYLFVLPYGSEIASFVRDPASGKVRLLEKITDDRDGIHGIESALGAVDPDGVALYATSARDDALVVFSIDPCGTAGRTKLVLGRVGADPVAGNDTLKLKADTLLRHATFAELDPIATGGRLVVTAADGTPRLDVTLPPGALAGAGSAGWKVNRAGTVWSFADTSAAPAGGIKKIKLRDRGSVLPRLISVTVSGTKGTYPVTAGDEPVQARLEIGSSALCSTSDFTAEECVFNASKLTCAAG